MTKSLCTFILALLFMLSSAFLAPKSAHASIKERGGGNITEAGKLADLEFVRSSKPLTSEVEALLTKPLEHLMPLAPELAALFLPHGLQGQETRFYLTPNEINDSECALKAPVALKAKTAACNIKINERLSNVFITRSFWAHATQSEKLSLVLHEQLRSEQLRLGASTDVPLFRLTDSVLRFISIAERQGSTISEREEAARQLLQIALEGGFGAFSLGLTQHAVVQAAVDAFTPYCASQTSVWPSETLRASGAPLLAELINQSLPQATFEGDLAASCASFQLNISRAIAAHTGAIEKLYPLYWR